MFYLWCRWSEGLTQEAGHLLPRFGHIHLQDKVCMRAEAQQIALLSPKLNQLLQDNRVLLQTQRSTDEVRGQTVMEKLPLQPQNSWSRAKVLVISCRFLWRTHLLAAGVEGLLQLLAGFWNEAFLHGGEVVGILQRDLQIVSILLQRVQEVLWKASCWFHRTQEHHQTGSCSQHYQGKRF